MRHECPWREQCIKSKGGLAELDRLVGLSENMPGDSIKAFARMSNTGFRCAAWHRVHLWRYDQYCVCTTWRAGAGILRRTLELALRGIDVGVTGEDFLLCLKHEFPARRFLRFKRIPVLDRVLVLPELECAPNGR